MLVTIHPGLDCANKTVTFYWFKTVGTASVVATTPALVHTAPDVAANGVVAPSWASAHHVVPFNQSSVMFYLSLSHGAGPEPIRHILSVPSTSQLSLLPGPFTGPFTPDVIVPFNLSFSCANSVDGGNVTVTLDPSPFRPTRFSFFKACSPVPHLQILRVNAQSGPLSTAVADGVVLPKWTLHADAPAGTYPTSVIVGSSAADAVTYFSVDLVPYTYVGSYRLSPPALTARPLFGGVGGASANVTGVFANGGLVDTTARMFGVRYTCGSYDGATLFTVSMRALNVVEGLNPPAPSVPFVFSWVKTCNHALGLTVNGYAPGQALPSHVVVNGGVQPGWSSPVALHPSVDFLEFTVQVLPPLPPLPMSKALTPVPSDGSIVPLPHGPLVDRDVAPVLPNNATPYVVELWVKQAFPDPITVTVSFISDYYTRFDVAVTTVAAPHRHLFVSYPPFSKSHVVAEGVPQPGWDFSASHKFDHPCDAVTPPHLLLSMTYDSAGRATVGPPRVRVDVPGACAPSAHFTSKDGVPLGPFAHANDTTPFQLNITSSAGVLLAVTFNCTTLHGVVQLTTTVPVLADAKRSTAYSPFKFRFLVDTDTNPTTPPQGAPNNTVFARTAPTTVSVAVTMPGDGCSVLSAVAVEVFGAATGSVHQLRGPAASLGGGGGIVSLFNTSVAVPFRDAAPGSPFSFAVPLPSANTTYFVRVAARNAQGLGPFSALSQPLPPVAPPSRTPAPSASPTTTPSPSVVPDASHNANDQNKRAFSFVVVWLCFGCAVVHHVVALRVVRVVSVVAGQCFTFLCWWASLSRRARLCWRS